MNTTKAEKILKQIKVNRAKVLGNYPQLASQVTELKRSVAQNLNAVMAKAIVSLKGKGCHVSIANNAQEARGQILGILAGVKKVVISKNPIFSEIELAPFLEAQSVEIIRTDLGERLSASEIDVHPWIATINTPILDQEAIHRIKEEIREQASHTDYGLTGADAIIAQNGTIALLESEGNVRFTSNLPYNHIAVVGIEKIVPTLDDALTVCRASSVYGLGKDLLNYISFISGPSRTADIEFKMVLGMHGPKEVYVILVDNGRLDASARGDLDALMCLHCGGCLVDCQSYLKEGLEKGYRYSGKWKRVLASFMPKGEGAKNESEEACAGLCPVGIQC